MFDIDDALDEVRSDIRDDPDLIEWGDGLPHARPDDGADDGDRRVPATDARQAASAAATGLDVWLWFG